LGGGVVFGGREGGRHYGCKKNRILDMLYTVRFIGREVYCYLKGGEKGRSSRSRNLRWNRNLSEPHRLAPARKEERRKCQPPTYLTGLEASSQRCFNISLQYKDRVGKRPRGKKRGEGKEKERPRSEGQPVLNEKFFY